MDFKEATDILTSAPPMTLGRIAEVFGKEMHTIARARMDGPNARRPPGNWEMILAELAQTHASTLREYAEQLDALAHTLQQSP